MKWNWKTSVHFNQEYRVGPHQQYGSVSLINSTVQLTSANSPNPGMKLYPPWPTQSGSNHKRCGRAFCQPFSNLKFDRAVSTMAIHQLMEWNWNLLQVCRWWRKPHWRLLWPWTWLKWRPAAVASLSEVTRPHRDHQQVPFCFIFVYFSSSSSLVLI